jgi:hypothetical protein
MKQNIVVDSSDSVEVRDRNGKLLFSWDGGSESDEVAGVLEFDNPAQVPIGDFVRDLCEFPEIVEMVDAWVDFKSYCNFAGSVVVGGYGNSTVRVKVCLDGVEYGCDGVELESVRNDMLYHFITFVQYTAVDIDFSREGDDLMSLIGDNLCSNLTRDQFTELADVALSCYSSGTSGTSGTKEKAFFKYVYESLPMEEFRKRFELAVSLTLSIREELGKDSEIVNRLHDVIGENTRLRKGDILEVHEYVVESFWDDLRGIPIIV